MSESVPPLFQIADISPAPDAETLAVITAALDQTWPQPVAVGSWKPAAEVETWRFARRRWNERAVPRLAWRNTR